MFQPPAHYSCRNPNSNLNPCSSCLPAVPCRRWQASKKPETAGYVLLPGARLMSVARSHSCQRCILRLCRDSVDELLQSRHIVFGSVFKVQHGVSRKMKLYMWCLLPHPETPLLQG